MRKILNIAAWFAFSFWTTQAMAQASLSSVERVPAPSMDLDRDGIDDRMDNCRTRFNPDQRDSNFDGVGDGCQMHKILELQLRSLEIQPFYIWNPSSGYRPLYL